MKMLTSKASILCGVSLLCMAVSAIAQNNNIVKEKFNWGNGNQDTTAGYAQAVKIDNVIYLSGTVSRDVSTEGIKRLYGALEVKKQGVDQMINPFYCRDRRKASI